MSSTGRGAKRAANDNYPTPEWCVHRLLEAVALPGGAWLEPAVGAGAIVRAVNAFRGDVDWTTVDVRPEVMPDLATDFLASGTLEGTGFDVAITNPPYAFAEEFAKKCRRIADTTVMLLRLNFMGAECRAEWLREDPPSIYVLPNRPSFLGAGNDSCEYGWFIWGPHTKVAAVEGSIRVLGSTSKQTRKGQR